MEHLSEIAALIDEEKDLRQKLNLVVKTKNQRVKELQDAMVNQNKNTVKYGSKTFSISNVKRSKRLTTLDKQEHVKNFLVQHGLSGNKYMIDGILSSQKPSQQSTTILRVKNSKKN